MWNYSVISARTRHKRGAVQIRFRASVNDFVCAGSFSKTGANVVILLLRDLESQGQLRNEAFGTRTPFGPPALSPRLGVENSGHYVTDQPGKNEKEWLVKQMLMSSSIDVYFLWALWKRPREKAKNESALALRQGAFNQDTTQPAWTSSCLLNHVVLFLPALNRLCIDC